uniref:Apolipoprotein A-IV n=1 Tax=Pelusios castaneus TaxID=367368 RepID=A0A8C8SBE5_9SAUR
MLAGALSRVQDHLVNACPAGKAALSLSWTGPMETASCGGSFHPTGCQAASFSEEPTPKHEQVREAFWAYVAKADWSGRGGAGLDLFLRPLISWGPARAPFPSQPCLAPHSSRISHSLAAASTYSSELQKQLPPVTREIVARLSKDTELLAQRTTGDLWDVSQRAQPYMEELQQTVQQSIAELHAGLTPYAEGLLEQQEQHTKTLRHSLVAGTQKLSQKLQQSLEELRGQLGPYTQELSGQLQRWVPDFQQGLEPYMQQLQGSLSQSVQHSRRNLQPYAEDLRQTLDPHAEDLQRRLGSLWASFWQPFQ